jgi:ribosomal RNA-processing protein 1
MCGQKVRGTRASRLSGSFSSCFLCLTHPHTDGMENTRGLNRALAHNDKQVREKGLRKVRKWLQLREEVSEQEMEKLWAGLFYSFWMSDKAPVQRDLAFRMSEILLVLSEDRALGFFSAFLTTLMREWHGIDRLRLSKFMTLVRLFFNAMFKYLAARDWNEDLCEEFLEVCQPVVHVDSLDVHRDLFLHIADVYLEEIFRTTRDENTALPWRVLMGMLSPFLEILTYHSESAVVSRVLRSVITPLFVSEEEDDGGVRNEATREMLKENNVELGMLFFSLASAQSTPAGARNIMYELFDRCDKDERTGNDGHMLMDDDNDAPASPSSSPSSSSSSSSSSNSLKRKHMPSSSSSSLQGEDGSFDMEVDASASSDSAEEQPPVSTKRKKQKGGKKQKDKGMSAEDQAMMAAWKQQLADQDKRNNAKEEQVDDAPIEKKQKQQPKKQQPKKQKQKELLEPQKPQEAPVQAAAAETKAEPEAPLPAKKKKKKSKKRSKKSKDAEAVTGEPVQEQPTAAPASVMAAPAALKKKKKAARRKSIQFAETLQHVKKFKRSSVVETPTKSRKAKQPVSILKSPPAPSSQSHQSLIQQLAKHSTSFHR